MSIQPVIACSVVSAALATARLILSMAGAYYRRFYSGSSVIYEVVAKPA